MKSKMLFGAVAAAALSLFSSAAHAQDSGKKLYASVTSGQSWAANVSNAATLGGAVGYEAHKNVRLETSYDHAFNAAALQADLWTAQAVLQMPIANRLVPYALAGGGYQWQQTMGNQGVWVVGGGLRVHASESVDIDARYRYVQGLTSQQPENVVSVGTSLKF